METNEAPGNNNIGEHKSSSESSPQRQHSLESYTVATNIFGLGRRGSESRRPSGDGVGAAGRSRAIAKAMQEKAANRQEYE